MGILHLTAAVCLWWHPHAALGLFQRSHSQTPDHISLDNAWDFSALLQPHSFSLNWEMKPQLPARSENWHLPEDMSSEGALEARGMDLVTDCCWQRKWGFSGHLLWPLLDDVRSLRNAESRLSGPWMRKTCSLASGLWTALVALVQTNLQLS